MVRTLPHGVYAPIPTFFDSNEDVDVETTSKHTVYLAKLGMLPVICGSMGEVRLFLLVVRDGRRVTSLLSQGGPELT
jgi:dihydrodipicolinate synthase/N-acetylneuraminate lyase